MSRLIPLGPVKQRYCPQCKLIVSQLCTHVVDPVITTETKRNPSPTPGSSLAAMFAVPSTPQQLVERAEARKKVDLATPDITDNGQLVYRYVPGMKYCSSPYTRVYPRFEASGNIFGPLERNFKDEKVYKEGSFTPRKRQPRKGKKAQTAKPRQKVGGVKVNPQPNADGITCAEPIKPVATQFEEHQSILALRKEWLDSRRGVFTSFKKYQDPEAASTSHEMPYVLQLPEEACESAGQA